MRVLVNTQFLSSERDAQVAVVDSVRQQQVVMNIFRFIGDMCHLLSFLVLYHKIHRTRSCKGTLPTVRPAEHSCNKQRLIVGGMLRDSDHAAGTMAREEGIPITVLSLQASRSRLSSCTYWSLCCGTWTFLPASFLCALHFQFSTSVQNACCACACTACGTARKPAVC